MKRVIFYPILLSKIGQARRTLAIIRRRVHAIRPERRKLFTPLNAAASQSAAAASTSEVKSTEELKQAGDPT
jgi:hypothetical protein